MRSADKSAKGQHLRPAMAEKAHLRGESAYSLLLDGYRFIRGERRLVLETRCSVIATSVLFGSLCSRITSFSLCKARNLLAASSRIRAGVPRSRRWAAT